MNNALLRTVSQRRSALAHQTESQVEISAPPNDVGRSSELFVRRGGAAAGMLIAAAVALAVGYATRKSDFIVPYEGLGYYLGIAGGTMMLLQIWYSAVKRLKIFRGVTSSRFLFNAHMFLGLAGPITILYHCRFSWGAFNSNIALITMSLVVISGIAGRIIYRHLRSDLNNKRADAYALLKHSQRLIGLGEGDTVVTSEITMWLSELVTPLDAQNLPLRRQIAASRAIRLKKKNAHLEFSSMIRRVLTDNAEKNGWSQAEAQQRLEDANRHVREFLESSAASDRLLVWERVLTNWHYFHVPLYYLLVASGVAHVLAVHWY